MTKKNKGNFTTTKPTFVLESVVKRELLGMTKNQSIALRSKLPKGIYWIQPGRFIFWNVELLIDYLVNGDSDHHRAMVERFLASLPQSSA
jgi:hypothetical protein